MWDYVVFSILLFVSTVYPIWKDISERKGKGTKANYIFGHGKVSMFAMMLSIARGTLGVRTFLGNNTLMPSVKNEVSIIPAQQY